LWLTSESVVGLVSALCLNLTIQTAGRFAFGVIVPIIVKQEEKFVPQRIGANVPHTQSIIPNSQKLNIKRTFYTYLFLLHIDVMKQNKILNFGNIFSKILTLFFQLLFVIYAVNN